MTASIDAQLSVHALHAARCVRAHLIDEGTAIRLLKQRRDNGLIPYFTDDEDIEASFRGALKGVAAPGMEGLQAFTWGDQLTDSANLKPSEWAIYKMIPKECTGLVYGGWGTCKTFLMIDWAGAICNGLPWISRKSKQGTVFYLAGEGEGGFARRLRAWEIANGGTMSNLAFRQMPNIRHPVELASMMVEIDQLACERGNPAMIVIDTLFTALNGGEENGGKDMGEVFQAMRRLREHFKCAVIAVHHTGHEGTRARGHSSMPAGVDVQFFIEPVGKSRPMLLKLTNPKQKDGKEQDEMHLTTESVLIDGLVDDEGETEASLVMRSPAAELTAALLEKASNAGPRLEELQAEARQLKAKGMTLKAISEIVGKDKSTISRWLKEP